MAPGKYWSLVGALQREPLGTEPEPPPFRVGGSDGVAGLKVRAVMMVGEEMGMGEEYSIAEGEGSGASEKAGPPARVAWKRKSELVRP